MAASLAQVDPHSLILAKGHFKADKTEDTLKEKLQAEES